MLAEVKQRLGGRDGPVTDGTLLSCVIYSLNQDFGAQITEIMCDLWAVVCASTYRDSDDPFEVSIYCDNVEDGIAAAWKAFADRKDGNAAAGADGPGIGLAGDLPGEGGGADDVHDSHRTSAG